MSVDNLPNNKCFIDWRGYGGSVVKVETSFIEVAEDLPNEKSN